jgi:catechol 2,3-dioxygenase-like lactoylglutathione lyase family enzyme
MLSRRIFMLAPALWTLAIQRARTEKGSGMQIQRFGLYVLVAEVERSVSFYKSLFGCAPVVRTPALVGFEVAGGLFAIVSRHAFAPGIRPGGSVRPYLRVADLDAAFDHVRRLAPDAVEQDRVIEEPGFRFFRFTDPDGNVLELFSLPSPGAAAQPS